LIEALTKAAGTGGIVRINEAEYIEKKNLFPFNPLNPLGRRSESEKLRIAPRAGMEGKAFRPPPPKQVSLAAPPAATEPAAPVVDGVPQAPNAAPDYVPKMGRVGALSQEPAE